MGYTSGWDSKKELVSYLLREDSNSKVIDSSLRGNVLYSVRKYKWGAQMILVDLLSCYNGEWGYKDLTECSYPYQFDCPERLLKLSTESDKMAVLWREKCRKVRAEKRERTKRHKSLVGGQTLYQVVYGEVNEVGFYGIVRGKVAYYEKDKRENLFYLTDAEYFHTREEAEAHLEEKRLEREALNAA